MTDRDAASASFGEELGGATPLTDEEKEGLKPSWIATRADLNAAERANIAKGLRRSHWIRLSTNGLLDDLTLRQLRKAMFGDVWAWAGGYRQSERNLRCDPGYISVNVRSLCEDARYWFAGAYMTSGEAGCTFHRDLVAIHPLANENGATRERSQTF